MTGGVKCTLLSVKIRFYIDETCAQDIISAVGVKSVDRAAYL
jgi:hypothetical protein